MTRGVRKSIRWVAVAQRVRRSVFIALLALAAQSCASYERVPTEHILMFNKRGRPVDPAPHSGTTHYTFLEYEELDEARYEAHLDSVFANIEAWTAERRRVDPRQKRRILIFIHGGLNTPVGTVGRAVELHEKIRDAGYYPLFVNWESSLVTSYLDHLWNVRQGRDRSPWGAVLAPYYLVSDLLWGIIRLPHVAFFQLDNIWDQQVGQVYRALPLDRVPGKDFVDSMIATMRDKLIVSVAPHEVSRRLVRRYRERRHFRTGEHPGAIAISEGADRRVRSDKIWPWVTYTLTIPTKLVSAIGVSVSGASAWKNMMRGVRLLFHAEEDFTSPTPDIEPSGGMAIFLRELRKRYEENPEEWDITLIGHSMGTIVLNELIRQASDLRYDNIVYMAAACTIRDYEDTLFPYLRSEAGENTEVFHLTLHEQAESGEECIEILGVDPVIRGSLLVWIDRLLAEPQTPLDYTLGQYNNLMTAVHNTPDDVRGRLHIKAFDVGPHLNEDGVVRHPQKHGEFTDAEFWKPSFWEPDGVAR